MRRFLIRTQLLFVSLLVLATMVLTMAIVNRYNRRWDLTQDKSFSLAGPTKHLLEQMRGDELEIFAFYPQDDIARSELEVFLRQMKEAHNGLVYRFYDPDRVPSLARQFAVDQPYTLILRYKNNTERILRPTEQVFANSLLRLANPRTLGVCFVAGHGEASITLQEKTGYSAFQKTLETSNYATHEIVLSRDRVPQQCQIVVLAGPHRDLENEEFTLLKTAFEEGRGILFLIDPMDPGMGGSFNQFMLMFGVQLSGDVIVDKMGRLVGGDFLVPLVSRYLNDHPVSKDFTLPTFFPVTRSVQPSSEDRPGFSVAPLAFTGSGSWAETDLLSLEQGQSDFNAEADVSGPLPVAVAVEQSSGGGRMIVAGDSDFLSNAYIDVAGNRDFAMRMVQWLAKDERFITIPPRQSSFKPLLLTPSQSARVTLVAVAGFPAAFLIFGALRIIVRQKTS